MGNPSTLDHTLVGWEREEQDCRNKLLLSGNPDYQDGHQSYLNPSCFKPRESQISQSVRVHIFLDKTFSWLDPKSSPGMASEKIDTVNGWNTSYCIKIKQLW